MRKSPLREIGNIMMCLDLHTIEHFKLANDIEEWWCVREQLWAQYWRMG